MSAWFVHHPVGTTLLAIGVLLLGAFAFFQLPVANLPSVDFPVVFISTGYPGASAETMATAVAAPIERRVGEISGVKSIASINALGSTLIFVTFELGRNIDHAARDVQAALNAAVVDLPAGLPALPTFRKANPDSAPILILALTSDSLSASELYDAADSVLLQRLSQVEGVAAVNLAGADQPAVRITADPQRLSAMNLSLDDLRSAVVDANALTPIGAIDGRAYGRAIATDDQLTKLDDYRRLVVRNAAGSSALLGDLATVARGSRNDMSEATLNGRPAVLVSVTKAPGANVIRTVEAIEALLPQLDRFLPPAARISVLHDRATTIRASVDDMALTLLVSVVLVVAVVWLFLRRLASVIAAAVTIPLALAGTGIGMWLAGFSLDNISLMALATAIGFVVDDAVVMIETIDRKREAGASPLAAAVTGAGEVWFTLLAISVSLLGAFIPLLFLGGVVGRFFREFSVTLAFAVVASTLASLTVTPMLCALLGERRPLRSAAAPRAPGKDSDPSRRSLLSRSAALAIRGYDRSLRLALRFHPLAAASLVATVAATIWLFADLPKGLFPRQDSDLLLGTTQAASNTSFQALAELQHRVVAALLADPAIAAVGSTLGSSGGRTSPVNQGRLFIALKPPAQRGGLSSDAVIARLRGRLRPIIGITTYLQSLQELQGGGPAAKSPLQVVLADTDERELLRAYPAILARLKSLPGLVDVSDDHGLEGLQADLAIDRCAASRLGITMTGIDNALANSFAQRQVAVIYGARNQYRVVLSLPRSAQRRPADILETYVPAGVTPLASSSLSGAVVQAGLSAASQLDASKRPGLHVDATAQVQLRTIATLATGTTPLAINHRDQLPEITLSFAAAGQPDEAAMREALAAIAAMHPPDGLRVLAGGLEEGGEDGAGAMLVILGIAAIFITLGVLYESLAHPLTILSTLPSAGLGALLALAATGANLDRIALIGLLLTVSIAKKNGILLVDFALDAQRRLTLPAAQAIREAALDRLRPILMTTLASVLGAVPLLVASGPGAALRRPLGLTVIGGLMVAQVLTLYTTPVIFLYVEAARNFIMRGMRRQPR